MAKFILRRLLLMLLTMFLVSVAVFVITAAAPGNVARNVLGIQVTAEQEASFLAQNGLDRPVYERYLYWLAGTDWLAASRIGLPMKKIITPDGFTEWWAVTENGTLTQWKLSGDTLLAEQRQADGTLVEKPDNGRWQVKDPAGEATRLEAYRAALTNNPQLTDADRNSILQAVDQILQTLRAKAQSQTSLLAGLAQPEGALDALRDPKAATEKQALQKVAADVAGNDNLLEAVAVYQALAAPTASRLNLSDRQFMADQLNQGSIQMKDVDAGLAGQLQQASLSLKAGDVKAATTALAGAVPSLKHLTGNLSAWTDAVQSGDYQAAVQVFRDLADPAKNNFDAAQLAVLPALLQSAGNTLDDADANIGDPFLTGVTSLKHGNPDDARKSFAESADVLSGVGQVISRYDAAGKAKVARVFWGVDVQNHAVQWETGTSTDVWVFVQGTGWMAFSGGPVAYIPLQQGLLRGDPGISLRTGRPVSDLLFLRLRNSLVLAGTAFVIVMPLALILGIIAGLNEGKLLDRVLSIGGMMFSVTPEFATGIFLILIFAFWLKLVPGATVFGEKAPWTQPQMLILPIATLTLIELGYVLRITRASMVEVMKTAYVRTAFLKGLPYWRIVFKHAVRNALMAPITVIMLHVNWLLGGIVVVEVIFGYPGLGSYLLDSALFKDFNAIEGGAMILVLVAVSTQLLADVVYTFINPRIRYA
jgi:ABC-type dipeptide/oligopeptide/nickel transport system permease component